MIVGERKPKFSFSSVSDILGDDYEQTELDDLDIALWTEPREDNAPVYKMREAELEVRRLGRPLTDEELEKFRVK